MLYSVLSYLFCTAPMLQSNPSPWQVAIGAVDRAIPAWRQMCSDWGIVFEADPHEDEEDLVQEKGNDKNNNNNNHIPSSAIAKPYRPNVIVKPSGALVDDKRVAKVAKQVLAACSAAKAAISRRNEAVRIWELVRERIRASAWHAMLQRSVGKPIEFIDRKSIREYKSFTRLRGFKYGGGGSNDTAKGSTDGMPLWDRLSLEDVPRGKCSCNIFLNI
jgi:hypothetical protein